MAEVILLAILIALVIFTGTERIVWAYALGITLFALDAAMLTLRIIKLLGQ